MATATEIIGSLKARGVILEPDGAGGLRVNGISRLTEREKAALRAHKATILKALAASNDPPTSATVEGLKAVTAPLPSRLTPLEPGNTELSPDDQEAYEERAAIMEHDGGLSRQEAERKAAEANRQAMPIIAGVVDQFRQVFGADQVKVIYAEEGGWTLGTPPATEPAPHDQQEEPSLIIECRTCLRYGPRDHYCGHKLRVIRDGEGIICAGKGYSPKGSPWKETTLAEW